MKKSVEYYPPQEQKCVYAHSYTQIPVDRHVSQVQAALESRSIAGYRKYGCTTERTDLNVKQWMQHLQEELMDAIVYIETIKEKL